MKTTLNIDERLLNEAMRVSRSRTKTETVELGLKEIVRKHRLEELARLGGSVHLNLPPRRRPGRK